MTSKTHPFEFYLQNILNKCSAFTPREIEGLLAIMVSLIGCPSFSLKEVAKNSFQNFSRNFLANCLIKYAKAQEEIIKVALTETRDWSRYTGKISLLLDDTIVMKSGKHIFGTARFFDHSKGYSYNSLCLVNVAISLKGELLFILPWILLDGKKTSKKKDYLRQGRDQKTLAGIELFEFYSNYFKEYSISSSKIIVLADSWFSNKTMMEFVKENKLIYRLDAKKNYQVQEPDHEAISKRNEKKRGRKRKKFVKYCSLMVYFTKNGKWSSFIDSKKNKRVYYKSAEVTLKTAGRVRVYAFKWEGNDKIKFILTPPLRIRKPTAKRVYEDYAVRWVIETAHRDLKQQFGISKSQSRKEWVVRGFIGLVNLTYSLWKSWASSLKQTQNIVLKCPTWTKWFYHQQIFKNYFVLEG